VADKTIEIRWSDLDGYGHVNQAVYVTYAEEVLDAWFRERLGIEPGGAGWDYVAAKTTVEYRSELRLGDAPVTGRVDGAKLGTKSVSAHVRLAAADGRTAAEVEMVVVVIDGKGGGSRALTGAEREALGR
jgi:acyl-CoA thioester hydrolase